MGGDLLFGRFANVLTSQTYIGDLHGKSGPAAASHDFKLHGRTHARLFKELGEFADAARACR
jgi:hypothetical protein